VEAHDTARRLEIVGGIKLVHDRVVILHEGQVQVRDDGVLVIAGVSDDGRIFGVTLQVAVGVIEQQVLSVLLVVEEHVVIGPAAVEAVQIKTRSPEIAKSGWIVDAVKLGDRIEGQIVVDELSQVGKPGRQVLVDVRGFRSIFHIIRFFDHRLRQGDEVGVIRREGPQVAEETPEPTLMQLRPWRRHETAQNTTVVEHHLNFSLPVDQHS
jgi:hypothetical protein